ncbi:MAG: hypothetical protein ACTHJR_04980 [Sphingomonas sp.]|uniref:hypothetical protein n=1 Tax=Sphingomonas sp. TaxID=28214 RepID=UPI003F81E7A5
MSARPRPSRAAGALAWFSAILLPVGLVPLTWMTALAVNYCQFDCGRLGGLAIDGLIGACGLLTLAWLWLAVAMVRRRMTRLVLAAAVLADLILLTLGGIAAWTFGLL